MADGGPPALQPPPVVPVTPPASLVQPPTQQNQPISHIWPGQPTQPVLKLVTFQTRVFWKA